LVFRTLLRGLRFSFEKDAGRPLQFPGTGGRTLIFIVGYGDGTDWGHASAV